MAGARHGLRFRLFSMDHRKNYFSSIKALIETVAMKMQIIRINIPVRERPMLSESVEVVRLSEVKAEVARLETQASEWLSAAKLKVERYQKSTWFKGAYNYWYGNASACDGLLYSIKKFFD